MNKLSIPKPLLTIGLIAACSIPAAGIAATMPVKNDNAVVVSYADLNLNHPSGVETLYQRLKTGARKSCGTVNERYLAMSRQNRDCVEKALAKAVDRIDNDMLRQLHSS